MVENKENRKYGSIHKIGEEIAVYFLDGKILRGRLLKLLCLKER